MVSASAGARAASAQGRPGRCWVGSCSSCSSPRLCARASSGQVQPRSHPSCSLSPSSLPLLGPRPLWAAPGAQGGAWGGLGREAVVRAGDGGPGVVVPGLVPLRHVCGVRSAVAVGRWGTGRAFSMGRSGLTCWPRGCPLPSPAIVLLACVCPCPGDGECWGSRHTWGQGRRRQGGCGCSAGAAPWAGAPPSPEPTPRAPVRWQQGSMGLGLGKAPPRSVPARATAPELAAGPASTTPAPRRLALAPGRSPPLRA